MIDMFKKIVMKLLAIFGFELHRLHKNNKNEINQLFKKDKFLYYCNVYDQRRIFIQVPDVRAGWVAERSVEAESRVLFLTSILKCLRTDNYFDIGANYGEFSILALDFLRPVLVECNPLLLPCLEKTFEKKNALIVNNAVGINTDEDCFLKVNPLYSGKSTLIDSMGDPEEYIIRVKSISLSSLLDNYAVTSNNPLVIKIDIEGMEPYVLTDEFEKYLNANFPDWIIFVEFVAKHHNNTSIKQLCSAFGKYESLELSSRTFKFGSTMDLYSNEILDNFTVSDVYTDLCLNTFENLCYGLHKSKGYGDLIVFSNPLLAKNISDRIAT
jgi:FkbM family methyltransferase